MQLGGIRRKSYVVALAVGLAISGAAVPVQQTHASDLAQRGSNRGPGNGVTQTTTLQLPNTQIVNQTGTGGRNTGTTSTTGSGGNTGTGSGSGTTGLPRPGTPINNPNTVNTQNNNNQGTGGNTQGTGANTQGTGSNTQGTGGQGSTSGSGSSQNNATNNNQNGGNSNNQNSGQGGSQNNSQGGNQNSQGGNGGGPGNGSGGGNGPGNGQGGGSNHNIVQERGNRNNPHGFNSHLWVQNPQHLFVHVPHYVQFVPVIYHVYHGPFFAYEPDWYFYRHISFPQAFVVYVEEPVLLCATEYYFFEPEGVFYCFVG